MTEEDFLTRWSRRKREVAKAEAEPRVEATPAPEEPNPDATQKSEPEVDLASLPPIESINELTDITAFLRAGVPEELTRAALRRVWTTDPAIRDFVGLAENAWDFTDPTAMPGFGPLESSEDIRRMVASIVKQMGDVAESTAIGPDQRPSDSNALMDERGSKEPLRLADASGAADERSGAASDAEVSPQSSKIDTATQHDAAETEKVSLSAFRRSHGGALPQ